MGVNDTRTKANLESRGYTYWKTEYWCSFSRRRKDLLGFIDALGVQEGKPIIGVQTTSRGCISARRAKILASPLALLWLRAGQRIEIHGWDKHTPKGTRLLRWRVKVVEITEEDFHGSEED